MIDELKARIARSSTTASRPQAQATFAAAFRGDPDVRRARRRRQQPRRCIVTEWLDGTPLSRDHRLRHAGGARPRRPAATCEFLLAGPAPRRAAARRPAPGQLPAHDDGRLGVLDFGAVNRLPDGLPPRRSAGCSPRRSPATPRAWSAGLRDEGFIKAVDRLDADGLLDYLSPFLEPARHDDVHASRAPGCAQLFAHINDPRRPQFLVGLKLNLPPEYLLIHRVWLGGIGVLCQIEGAVPALEVAGPVAARLRPGRARRGARRAARRRLGRLTLPAPASPVTTRRCRASPRCCAGVPARTVAGPDPAPGLRWRRTR